MKSISRTLIAITLTIFSMASAQVLDRDGPGSDLWTRIDDCGSAEHNPQAVLDTIRPMMLHLPGDGEDAKRQSGKNDKLLEKIQAGIVSKNAIRHQLVERARHAEGDFSNPLLDARVQLEILRHTWQADSPAILQQRAKIADLESTLPPVSAEACLAHIWRRIVLAEKEAEQQHGDRDPQEVGTPTRTRATDDTHSLRIAALHTELIKVRQELRKPDATQLEQSDAPDHQPSVR